MAITQDTRQQIRKIDEQIIGLLAQRVNACRRALEEDEEGLAGDDLAETVSHWVEEGDERGLNVGVMGSIAKLAIRLCHVTEE